MMKLTIIEQIHRVYDIGDDWQLAEAITQELIHCRESEDAEGFANGVVNHELDYDTCANVSLADTKGKATAWLYDSETGETIADNGILEEPTEIIKLQGNRGFVCPVCGNVRQAIYGEICDVCRTKSQKVIGDPQQRRIFLVKLGDTIPEIHELFPRLCSFTNTGFTHGYYFGDDEKYIRNNKKLADHVAQKYDYADWDDAYSDENYWSEWDAYEAWEQDGVLYTLRGEAIYKQYFELLKQPATL